MVILRDTLRGLLYSRHTLPHLHCGVVVLLPLVAGVSHPSQHFLFYLLIQRHEEPTVIRWHSFQFSGIIVCLLVEAFPHLEPRPLGQQNINLWEKKQKCC